MPEFIMPECGTVAEKRFADLDAFTQGYIEAAFFTECHADNPELENAKFGDIAPDSLAKTIEECAAFQAANRADLDQALDDGRINGYDERRAGNDYWYTRNGHGVGFWDRDLGDIGDKLADAARYSERDVYCGDDGKVYIE